MLTGIGKLRHRIGIQTSSDTQNAYGEIEKAWTTAKTVWASVEPLTGRELFQAQQVVATASHRVRIRYDSTVTETSRVLFGSRIFDINAIMNRDERNAEIELLCTEAKV